MNGSRPEVAMLARLFGDWEGPANPCGAETIDGIAEKPAGFHVSENVGATGSNGSGQAISAVHSLPELMVKRKL